MGKSYLRHDGRNRFTVIYKDHEIYSCSGLERAENFSDGFNHCLWVLEKEKDGTFEESFPEDLRAVNRRSREYHNHMHCQDGGGQV